MAGRPIPGCARGRCRGHRASTAREHGVHAGVPRRVYPARDDAGEGRVHPGYLQTSDYVLGQSGPGLRPPASGLRPRPKVYIYGPVPSDLKFPNN